jgi:hypothetical protein
LRGESILAGRASDKLGKENRDGYRQKEVTFLSSMALLATKIVVKNNWIVTESLTRKKWRGSQKLV